jgi:hypothetical protein
MFGKQRAEGVTFKNLPCLKMYINQQAVVSSFILFAPDATCLLNLTYRFSF